MSIGASGVAAWHHVDIPIDEPKYDTQTENRRFYLRFLVHLVGEVHQPSDVGDNHERGRKDPQVRWFGYGSNQQKVWDRDLIEWVDKTEEFWLAALAELDTVENRTAWMSGTAEEWATESLLTARAA
jgi:hypothetical protein